MALGKIGRGRLVIAQASSAREEKSGFRWTIRPTRGVGLSGFTLRRGSYEETCEGTRFVPGNRQDPG